ncbi:MAG: ATP synthase F1 subunit delta [Oligoflexales bacterium]
MKADSIAKRYANALILEIAGDQEKAQLWCEQLESVCLVFSMRDAEMILKNPTAEKETKKELLFSVLDEVKAETELKGLCLTLLNAGRVAWLPGVLTELQEHVRSLRNEQHGVVKTAVALSEAEVNEIAMRLSKKLGCTAILKNEVDPELLAGFQIRLGMRLVDMTLRKKLQTLMGCGSTTEVRV